MMKPFFWNRPHPFIFNFASVVVPSLLTLVVIFLLAPFSYASQSLGSRFIQALISAGIVATCIWCSVATLKRFLPRWAKPESWTIGKEIGLFLLVVLFIALTHFALFLLQQTEASPFVLFQQVVLRTVAISFFPIIGLVAFEQYSHRTKQLKRALALNKAIRNLHVRKESNEYEAEQSSLDKVWFFGENGKPVCQLPAHSIQFIQASGNYIEVFYLAELTTLKKQLIRNTLSAIEKTLDQPHFWRVHRSYLVNLHQVETVSGNARDLELVMKQSGEHVPVSRTKASQLMQEIAQMAHSSQPAPNQPK